MSDDDAVSLRLPFGPRSAGVARRAMGAWLTTCEQPPAVIENSQLVLSELVCNAVRHARPLADGTVLVQWTRQGPDLDLAVSDGGSPTVPHVADMGVSALAGRGLSIVDQLSNRWWLETTRSRSTVHALLDLD